VIAVASNKFQNMGKKLMLVTPTSATSVSDTGLPWGLSSVWFTGRRHFFVYGNGVFKTRSLAGMWQEDNQHPLIYKNRIRGRGLNDIFIVGAFGLVSHFNGVSWYHYTGNELPSFAGEYDGVDVTNNLIIAVGFLNDGRAIVLRGRRQ
jgi:hypothetical protein